MVETLDDQEVRVLGALIEKQVTTPDHYPLTLKALVSACNQSSSRDPVMNLSEQDVADIVSRLEAKYLVSQRTEYGSRVSKHRQRWCNTEFGDLQLTPGERAAICVLMLRGPQTPGEIRSRGQRLHGFDSVAEVEEALSALAARDPGLAVRLAREPGRREARYAHLLSGPVADADGDSRDTAAAVTPTSASLEERIAHLEEQVAQLQARLAERD